MFIEMRLIVDVELCAVELMARRYIGTVDAVARFRVAGHAPGTYNEYPDCMTPTIVLDEITTNR